MQDCTARVWDLEAGTSLHCLEGVLHQRGSPVHCKKLPDISLQVLQGGKMRIKPSAEGARCTQATRTSSAARRWRRMGPL